MLTIPRLLPFLGLLICSIAAASAPEVTSPETYLGKPMGEDFQLADWKQVQGYFQKLAQQSPCVKTEKVGTTTEGRDFLLVTITDSESLARLKTIKKHAKTIADPRGKSDAEQAEAVREGKVILFVSCNMHSTEIGSSLFSMEFAYLLATSNEEPWRSARQRLVVVLAPSINPDGLDHVVSWYREMVGTPYEASSLLKLYQYYTGHDNNRDWFMLTQAETRIVTEQVYSVWRPQVYWDIHPAGLDARAHVRAAVPRPAEPEPRSADYLGDRRAGQPGIVGHDA